MTRFIDGPAEGQSLSLKRAPVFLRVVFNHTTETWDALDRLEDEPELGEDVHVYWLNSKPGICHLHSRKPGASGWFTIAEYKHCNTLSISQIELRDNNQWYLWVRANCACAPCKEDTEIAPHLR